MIRMFSLLFIYFFVLLCVDCHDDDLEQDADIRVRKESRNLKREAAFGKVKFTVNEENKRKTRKGRRKPKTSKEKRKANRKSNRMSQKKRGNAKKKKDTKKGNKKRKATKRKGKSEKSKSKHKKKRKVGKKRNNGKNKTRKARKKGNKRKASKRDKRKKKKKLISYKRKEKLGKKGKSWKQSRNVTKCLTTFIEYSRINELKARSVQQQVNRVNNFKKILDNKKGKKGNFKGTYETLLSALGGNESAPECNGNPIGANRTSRQAKYKGTLMTLKECEATVEKMCNYPINSTYNSTLQGCLTAANKFKTEFKKCFDAKKSSDEACTCIDAMDKDNVKTLKKCNTKEDSDMIKSKRRKCVNDFLKCKTAQDDSVDGVGTCKKVNKCGGVANKSDAQRILNILNPLSKALANTGFADALKKLGLNSGAGSDGNLPNKAKTSRLAQLRAARLAGGRQNNNTDSQPCRDIEQEWMNFNTSGSKAVPSVSEDVDASETTKAINSLNKLNNRANLESDLGTCAKESSRQTATVILTIVKIRFYVFWCGWFQVTIVEVKITIIEISFGISSPSPPPVPTSPPGGLTTKGPTKATQANAVAPTSNNKCAKKTLANNCKIDCECFTLKCTVSTGTSTSTINQNNCVDGVTESFNNPPFTGKHGSNSFSLTAAESEKYGPCEIKCKKSGGAATFDGKISCAKKGNTYEWMSEAITKACPSGRS